MMSAQADESEDSIGIRYVTLQAISTRTGVTARRVRYLERAGLIDPAESDEHFRLYREETVERLLTIERLTNDLGVNLAGIEVILNMREQIIELRSQAGISSESTRDRT
jgi:MerR family transcriptional regulator/heat shock protein HspR